MLYLDRDTLARRLDRRVLIDRLEAAFAAADVTVPVRHAHSIEGGSDLLLMPAWRAGDALGVKLVTVFPGNARLSLPAVHACYVLFDGASGVLRAVLDGTELTLRRTGAASALAARHLAHGDARKLLMIGTGALAPHLIESHLLVRPIRSVRIWGRRPERAIALAGELATRLGTSPQHASLAIEPCADLAQAVAWADIVSCATLSTEPLIQGRWLRPGQHLDLVGAFRPDMREADEEALSRARIYVDTREGACAESGELIQARASRAIGPDAIRGELHELLTGRVPGRGSPNEITLFKSVGAALEDLAAAELALEAT